MTRVLINAQMSAFGDEAEILYSTRALPVLTHLRRESEFCISRAREIGYIFVQLPLKRDVPTSSRRAGSRRVPSAATCKERPFFLAPRKHIEQFRTLPLRHPSALGGWHETAPCNRVCHGRSRRRERVGPDLPFETSYDCGAVFRRWSVGYAGTFFGRAYAVVARPADHH